MREDRIRSDIKKFIQNLNETGEADAWIKSVHERYGEVDLSMRSFTVKPTLERFCQVADLLSHGIDIAIRTKDDRLSYYWWFAEGLALMSETPNGVVQFHGKPWTCDMEEPPPVMRKEIQRSVTRFAHSLMKWNETVSRSGEPQDSHGDTFRESIVACLDLKRLNQQSWSNIYPCYERKIRNYFDLLFSTQHGCSFHNGPLMKLYYFIQPISWPRELHKGRIEYENLFCQTTPEEMTFVDGIIDDIEEAYKLIRRTTEGLQQNRLILDADVLSDIRARFGCSAFAAPGEDVADVDKQLADEEIKRRIEKFSRHQLITPTGMDGILKILNPEMLEFAGKYHEQTYDEMDCNHKGLIGVVYEEFGWMIEAVEEILVGEHAEQGVLFGEAGRDLIERFQSWWWNICAVAPDEAYKSAYKEFVHAAKVAASKIATIDAAHQRRVGVSLADVMLVKVWNKIVDGGSELEAFPNPVTSMFVASLEKSAKTDRTGCASITIDVNRLPMWFRRMVGDDAGAMENAFGAMSDFMYYSVDHPDEYIGMVLAKYSDSINDSEGRPYLGSEFAHAICNTSIHARDVLNAARYLRGEISGESVCDFSDLIGAAFADFLAELRVVLPRVNTFYKRMARELELQLFIDAFRVTIFQVEDLYPGEAIDDVSKMVAGLWFFSACIDRHEKEKMVIDEKYITQLEENLDRVLDDVSAQEREVKKRVRMAQLEKRRMGLAEDFSEVKKELAGSRRREEAILYEVSGGAKGKPMEDARQCGAVRRKMVSEGYELVLTGKYDDSSAAREVVANHVGETGAYTDQETDTLRKAIARKRKGAGIRT